MDHFRGTMARQHGGQAASAAWGIERATCSRSHLAPDTCPSQNSDDNDNNDDNNNTSNNNNNNYYCNDNNNSDSPLTLPRRAAVRRSGLRTGGPRGDKS